MEIIEFQSNPQEFTAPFGISTCYDKLLAMNRDIAAQLPIAFFPYMDVTVKQLDPETMKFGVHKRVGRFSYASATGQLKKDGEGKTTVHYTTGISYRSLLLIAPVIVFGLYALLIRENLGAFVVFEGLVAINLGYTFFAGRSQIGDALHAVLTHTSPRPQWRD